jgi:dTMP kinase
MNGKLITFEGIDGCGKSTQAKKLYTKLSSINRISVLTREPGGSPGAEEIRHLLVKGEVTRWSAETEILLFTAARRDHLERTILPAIKEGKIVISDRFFDSTRIYQGAARSDLINIVDQLHKLVIDIVPDLTFIIDMEPKIALTRGLARKSGEDRFEEFGEPFQERIRHGFINLAMKEKERCFLIDGAQDQEIIADEIFAICSKNFNG